MRYLVTGSSGHLGEALMRSLRSQNQEAVGLDVNPGPFTDIISSIGDLNSVQSAMKDIDIVFHTATLHKPHIVTHSRQDFVDTNVLGTENLISAAIQNSCKAFIFTSTTSTFGHAMRPAANGPAVWVDETLTPQPKNIYGETKIAAEHLCQQAHKQFDLPVITLRTSRFFPEQDDDAKTRAKFSGPNIQMNEFAYRRVDIEDVVTAHFLAARRAKDLAYDMFIISAPPLFKKAEIQILCENAPAVLDKYPDLRNTYTQLGWSFPGQIDRVYCSEKAQQILGWQPKHDFESVLNRVAKGGSVLSDLAGRIGKKGYHDQDFSGEDPYPVH